MAEAALEQIEIHVSPEHFETQIFKLAQAVPEMAEDEFVRARAARFIGSCIVQEQVEVAPTEPMATRPIESLYGAIKEGARGNKTALNMIETNARTDIVERTIKAGHVTKVDLNVDEAGRIQQHGQSIESVQANSLRLAAANWQMRERTEAEATNAFRIEQLYKQGKLDDYSFVVFSRAADNMSHREMSEAGFFTNTMSCAIQVTTAHGSKITTESAFVAGVKNPGSARHDAETTVDTAEHFGVDLRDKTAAEIINTPILIHNSLMPNGVIDLVELYDKYGGNTFFGQDRPTEDYIKYLEKCKVREQTLRPTVNSIVRELIAEAANITTPLEAVKRLHKISEKHMVEQAAVDSSIDPLVFGPVAALYIEQARIQYAIGNHQAGRELLSQAKSTAVSSSCPSALRELSANFGDSRADSPDNIKLGEDKYGSRKFKCPKGHTNTRPHNKLIEKCQTCKISVRC